MRMALAIGALSAALNVATITPVTALGKGDPRHPEIISSLIIRVMEDWEIKYCLAKYNREVEKSKDLLAGNGSMTDFFYAQRQLRRKYFELDADRMVYEQMFIDVWEAFDIGQINLNTAMNYTTQIANKGYDGSKERMKNCR